MLEQTRPSERYAWPEFLPSIGDVQFAVFSYLKSVAEEFKPLACEPVVAGKGDSKYVLAGLVAFQVMKPANTDRKGTFLQEAHLVLGHAALGPSQALMTVSSVRRELMTLLANSLPARAVHEAQATSFKVVLPDGDLRLEAMVGAGRSYIQVTSTIPSKPVIRL
ncbi:hypothetical protein [Pseudomonas aeruginosa]|uniref:hypothetical protein n=1 Tax=Pseudomonas aeruginosa TaxID=287 RepID=UPI001044BF17|nr:hypothetical protein [Pseudomonas aeruginosa]